MYENFVDAAIEPISLAVLTGKMRYILLLHPSPRATGSAPEIL